MTHDVIYLDNNATTRVDPAAFEAAAPYFCDLYGNPSSIHTFGGNVAKAVLKARLQVAELLNAPYRNADGVPTEIIFTSCGTEADNAAILSGLAARPSRKKIVTTRVEHAALLNQCRNLEHEGYEVVRLGVDGHGRLDMDEVRRAIDADTAIVSVMWANNETGTVFPISEIAKIAHDHGALFHTDAVQAAGKIPIDLEKNSEIDMLSIAGHKLHAPKGIGVLFVRRGVRFKPFVVGGHQEFGRRGGTENVPSIVALGKAAELAREGLEEEVLRLGRLRDRLEKGVLGSIDHIRINGDLNSRLPNTSSISFEYIEGEAILLMLDQFGICASSGSACTTGSLEPSHVLRAMGLPYTAAHGTIRFSFSKFNTGEEVDRVLEVLPGVISTLRQLSPYWPPKES
ncbi:MAG: cysteine desulfurase NifS [Victivallaceae bacterium]|nr:cysteine desulfurase NifS [Victivallaceae bacterium]